MTTSSTQRPARRRLPLVAAALAGAVAFGAVSVGTAGAAQLPPGTPGPSQCPSPGGCWYTTSARILHQKSKTLSAESGFTLQLPNPPLTFENAVRYSVQCDSGYKASDTATMYYQGLGPWLYVSFGHLGRESTTDNGYTMCTITQSVQRNWGVHTNEYHGSPTDDQVRFYNQ